MLLKPDCGSWSGFPADIELNMAIHSRARQSMIALASATALVVAAALAWREGASLSATFIAATEFPAHLLVTVLGLSLLNYLLRFLRWDWLIGSESNSIPRGRHLVIYLAGFSLTLTPAKAGEALRTVYLLPYGISAQHSLSCLAVERVLDVMAVALLAALVVGFWPPGWVIVAPSLGGAAFGFAFLWWMSQRRIPLILPAWIPDRLGLAISSFAEALGQFGAGTIARTIPLSLAGWALEAVGLVLLVNHFIPDISSPLIVGIFGVAVLGGALTFLPGGLGGTELLMVALLTAAGMGGAEAVAVTAICRLATLWFGFVLGLCSLSLLGARLPISRV
jgi:uncharacterized protein (TIRG00374 family)